MTLFGIKVDLKPLLRNLNSILCELVSILKEGSTFRKALQSTLNVVRILSSLDLTLFSSPRPMSYTYVDRVLTSEIPAVSQIITLDPPLIITGNNPFGPGLRYKTKVCL